MCRTIVLLLAAALLPHAANADIVRHSAIPEAYVGSWTPSAGTYGGSDKVAVVLSAKAYVTSTASCTVDFVAETPSPRGPTYSARLQCSNSDGKGQTKSIVNLVIRPDSADRIAMGSSFNSLAAYQRCSASAPPAKQ